jgi:hypothetical protein
LKKRMPARTDNMAIGEKKNFCRQKRATEPRTKQTAVFSRPEGHVDISRSWSSLEFAITRVKIQAKKKSGSTGHITRLSKRSLVTVQTLHVQYEVLCNNC